MGKGSADVSVNQSTSMIMDVEADQATQYARAVNVVEVLKGKNDHMQVDLCKNEQTNLKQLGKKVVDELYQSMSGYGKTWSKHDIRNKLDQRKYELMQNNDLKPASRDRDLDMSMGLDRLPRARTEQRDRRLSNSRSRSNQPNKEESKRQTSTATNIMTQMNRERNENSNRQPLVRKGEGRLRPARQSLFPDQSHSNMMSMTVNKRRLGQSDASYMTNPVAVKP